MSDCVDGVATAENDVAFHVFFFQGLIWLPFGRFVQSKWLGEC